MGKVIQDQPFGDLYKDYQLRDGTLHIARRPPYCDRGAYLVQVFPINFLLTIDGADFFPRYYFHWDCLEKEMNTWIEKRGQNVNRE